MCGAGCGALGFIKEARRGVNKGTREILKYGHEGQEITKCRLVYRLGGPRGYLGSSGSIA